MRSKHRRETSWYKQEDHGKVRLVWKHDGELKPHCLAVTRQIWKPVCIAKNLSWPPTETNPELAECRPSQTPESRVISPKNRSVRRQAFIPRRHDSLDITGSRASKGSSCLLWTNVAFGNPFAMRGNLPLAVWNGWSIWLVIRLR